ncbi:MAG: glycoside hydrolase family 97 protein [Bacteroidales bacterium]|nr:glycoside hydrolase family 97 protein [Bacteroidales bacterium]
MTKMNRCILSFFTFFMMLAFSASAIDTSPVVTSPNQKLKVTLQLTDGVLIYKIEDDQGPVLDYSQVSMDLGDKGTLGWNPALNCKKVTRRGIRQQVSAPFYKRAYIPDNYNELTLFFRNYKVVFRVYDSGVAYRFETFFQDSLEVKDEQATFAFAGDFPAYVPYVVNDRKEGEPMDKLFETSFENQYMHLNHLSEMNPYRIAFLPLLVELPQGRKVVITESDLRDYPGMYLRNGVSEHYKALTGCFAPCPKRVEQGGHNNLQYRVKERHDYLAKTVGTRTFPWRVIAISHQDRELADNDLVYLLATPSKVSDVSWIKPGKVAWDWWNNWNIWGVDFKAGINNDTYKYYIDFASEKGIEYVILDEGWAVNKQADLFQVVPEIDLPMLVNYAKSKGVGIVLWAGYAAMDKDMEKVCQHYSQMGVKGFKVDFMDRDDQLVVNFYERMAAMAAKYHLFVDFHGAYKPTGLSRTYPNVLNYEGVFGLEQCKWIGPEVDMVTYETTIPFIRMLAGPMDFTQGAMRNASQGCFSPSWSEPMSQGTRCRQLAEYVIFDAPFAMLCDAPTAYLKEPECTEFIAQVPTVWDETRVLDGEVGKYIVTARRKGTTWYVGAITNWEKRSVTMDLSALGVNGGRVTIFTDGPNAQLKGVDYKKRTLSVRDMSQLTLELAPGGGAVVIVE